MTRDVNNREDVLDSRDIIARIDELENEIKENDDPDLPEDERFPLEDEREELRVLKELAKEGEGFSDWHDGATLVRRSFFKEYAQQLADDLGLIKEDATWPYDHIDWDAAADALEQDYGSVEFDGIEYLIRS